MSKATVSKAFQATLLLGIIAIVAPLAAQADQGGVQCRFEPSVLDTDGDGLTDVDELEIGSDPQSCDTDGDGRSDDSDNCILVPNWKQVDNDHDGYGNMCDSDFNNDDMVDETDREMLLGAYGLETRDAGFDKACDANSDGRIGAYEFAVFKLNEGQYPGPGAVDFE